MALEAAPLLFKDMGSEGLLKGAVRLRN